MKKVDIRLEVRADPALLRSVRSLLACYIRSRGFTEARTEEAVLAIDEACTNAIRHSYGGPCDETIELCLGSAEEGLEITVSDRGKPAPEEKVAPRALRAPDPAAIKPGGLGVGLMYRVFDEVDFRPGTERGNDVRLFLRWPEGAQARAEEGGR
jgi:anti-sigma regulatory factor (Ser/Thr protein kinase)